MVGGRADLRIGAKTSKFRQDHGNSGHDRGSHCIGEAAAQLRGFRDDADEQHFAGTFTAEFGKEKRFNERGIVKAKTLRDGSANKFRLAEKPYSPRGRFGADRIDQNDRVTVGEEEVMPRPGVPRSWSTTFGGNS